MGATKVDSSEQYIERGRMEEEEEFQSVLPYAVLEANVANDASHSEDFISLIPIADEKGDKRDENAEDDSNLRSSRKRNFHRLTSLPPWMAGYVDYRRVNPLVALHNEIVCFCKLMEPRKDEMKIRQDLVAKFTDLAQSTFNNACKVEVFGSQATGYVEKTWRNTYISLK